VTGSHAHSNEPSKQRKTSEFLEENQLYRFAYAMYYPKTWFCPRIPNVSRQIIVMKLVFARPYKRMSMEVHVY
jgi:hypothetical protein